MRLRHRLSIRTMHHTRAHFGTHAATLSQTARTHKHEHRPSQTRLCLRERDAPGSSAQLREEAQDDHACR